MVVLNVSDRHKGRKKFVKVDDFCLYLWFKNIKIWKN